MTDRPQPNWDRKCYYDKNGIEIEEGDLLKVYHFRHYLRRRKIYMYQVAVWREYKGLYMWGGKDYNAEKAHYNLYAVADKGTGILKGYEIISKPNFETEETKRKEGRIRIKQLTIK